MSTSPTVMAHTSPGGTATSSDNENDVNYLEWQQIDPHLSTHPSAHDDHAQDASLERDDPVSPPARPTSPPPYSPTTRGRPLTIAILWPARAKHAPAEAQDGLP